MSEQPKTTEGDDKKEAEAKEEKPLASPMIEAIEMAMVGIPFDEAFNDLARSLARFHKASVRLRDHGQRVLKAVAAAEENMKPARVAPVIEVKEAS